MNFIDQKKINPYIVIAVLFLSFGYAQLQSTRGTLAYLSYTYPTLSQTGWIFNDIVALIIGGVVPLIAYEIITAFTARFISMRLNGAESSMKYSLRFFYILANVVIGSVKFVYYATPVASVYGNVLIDFVVTTAFFVWFLAYSLKHYVVNTRWGVALMSVGGTYLVVQAILTVISLMSGVLL